jgi:hypothetical protein
MHIDDANPLSMAGGAKKKAAKPKSGKVGKSGKSGKSGSRSVARKKTGKKTGTKAPKKWLRTARKHRCNDGKKRTIWIKMETGQNYVRRVRVVNGARKAVYTKI